jgi:hypothetical protein
MKITTDLIAAGIEINSIVKVIQERYPELQKLNVIKRLVLTGDKWDKLFTECLKSQGRRA